MQSAKSQKSLALNQQSTAIAIITFAQLFGTSLWFSANSAAFDLMQAWQIGITEIGWLTNAVQAGFILGTFIIATTGIADRFAASRIFSLAAVMGALFNFAFAFLAQGLWDGMFYRFLVGICLAGIYPIGMKLAVQWAPNQKAQVLSLLIAMLTLGTALPYALTGLTNLIGQLNWQYVMSMASIFAILAAVMIYCLGDADAPAKTQTKQDRISAVPVHPLQAFKNPQFRAAAFGYFGHMWELYAFWTIVPLLIVHTELAQRLAFDQAALLSFFVIACGALGCLIVAQLNRYLSSSTLAIAALVLSTLCCICFALGWQFLPAEILLLILALWGAAVIADSPQFSALSAQACPPEQIGAALAIQNAIGFSITMISIALMSSALEWIGLDAVWILIIGPILGIFGFFSQTKNATKYSVSKGPSP